MRRCRDFTKSAPGDTNNTSFRKNLITSGIYAIQEYVKRAQREFWTDLRPPFGQNVARKAGIKRYEKKRKNENSGFSDLTKSAVFENEFANRLRASLMKSFCRSPHQTSEPGQAAYPPRTRGIPVRAPRERRARHAFRVACGT